MGKQIIDFGAGIRGFSFATDRYFVGASTHPGTDLPTVLVSSRLAAEQISQHAPLAKESISTSKRSTSL
jgi:hypothetical protein